MTVKTDAETNENNSSKVFKSVNRGNLSYKGNTPYFKGTKYLGWIDSKLNNSLLVSRYKTDEQNQLAYCLNWNLESPNFEGNEYLKSNEKITDKEYSAVVYGFGGEKDITGKYDINGRKLTNDERYYVTQVGTYVVSDDLDSRNLTVESLVEHTGKDHEVKNTKEMLNIIKDFVLYVEKNTLPVPQEENIEVTIHSTDDNSFKDKGTYYETETMKIESTNINGQLSLNDQNLGKAYFVDTNGQKVDKEYVLSGHDFHLRADKKDIEQDTIIDLSVNGLVTYQNVHKYVPKKGEIGYSGKELQRILWIGNSQNTDQATISFAIKNPHIKGSLEIKKVDIVNDEPLPNTTFQIKDEDGNVVVEGKTNEDGIATFDELPYGKYTYQEIEAPEGYVIDTKPYPFEIKEDGEVIKAIMENRLIEGSIKITKIDANTKELLEGVEFTLYDASGEVIEVKETDENGIVIFDKLIYGQYTIQETKELSNYKENRAVYEFDIVEDGQVFEETVTNEQEEQEKDIVEQEKDTVVPPKPKKENRSSEPEQKILKSDKGEFTENREVTKGLELPKTATNHYNLLFIGLLILISGGILSLYTLKKSRKNIE